MTTKSDLISKFARAKGDTGSPEVQIALLTARINSISEHFKTNKKDFSAGRGLMKLIGQRKGLLRYLADKDPAKYSKLISDLDLRK